MSTRTESLKPGDLVRPFMDLKWKSRFSSPPTPITLRKLPRQPRGGEPVKISELFEDKHVATLKWTETGLVLATFEEDVMVLFGEKFGWAPAKDFETLPEE